jgi:hypothetical protein
MENLIKKAAYHEAGHVVMSTINHIPVEKVFIDDSGNGATMFVKNTKSITIQRILTASPGDLRNIMNESTTRKTVLELAEKISPILLAGSVAENVFEVGQNAKGIQMIEVTGPDIVNLQFLERFLGIDLQEQITTIMEVIRDDLFFQPIKDLAEELLRKKFLNNKEIMKVLNRHKLFDLS